MSASSNLQFLDALVFDNSFTRELPVDPEAKNYPRQVMRSCYSLVHPTKVARPQLVAYAREVAELLDLSPAACESVEFTQVFSGNRLLSDMEYYAVCYGGHQFGSWAGQLGDGRAINLGEIVNQQGAALTRPATDGLAVPKNIDHFKRAVTAATWVVE